MATKQDHNDDDSFIILGTSPGTSLDIKCGSDGDKGLEKINLEDALKDLSDEAHMAYKAHFKLDNPSPGSMMVASTIVTDDSSTEDLQKRFGELLDENVLLKETLKHNNDSMKEQFLLIASCQEDMMKTQQLHKEKFQETKDLVERLRVENKKLKQDLFKKIEVATQTSDLPDSMSGPSSGLEFVTSPDDDTVNKLTAQLELIERQRRQVLVENEKLTWQKESLEHIVDATSKERDELKEKLHNLELSMTASEELVKRDAVIEQLSGKVSSLQGDLKNAQFKILELENVKLEFTKHRSGLSETVRIYKDQIQDLHNRLKEAQTIVFQPVRLSLNTESESSSGDSPWARMQASVRLYDRTLKHLADLLNGLTNGLSDSIVQTLGVVSSLHDFKLEKSTVEQFKSGLVDVKQRLEKQHSSSLNYVIEVRNTLSIFEGIFKEHNELLKKSVTAQDPKPVAPSANVEALTSALLARGQELQALENEVACLRSAADDRDLMQAQLDLYKTDFEAERGAREKMACEKENIMTDLRTAQKRIQELIGQLNAVRDINPDVYWSATTKRSPESASVPSPPRPTATDSRATNGTTNGTGIARTGTATKKTSATAGTKHSARTPTGAASADKKPVVKKKKLSEEQVPEERAGTPPPARYDCPVCDQPFKTLILLQQHVDSCLL